jgi:hypothetical protein
MNKRDRKVVKQEILWLKKGYNLHKRGDKDKLAAYNRKYERIVHYRMFGNHTPYEEARLDRRSSALFELIMSNKTDKYHTLCKGCGNGSICI